MMTALNWKASERRVTAPVPSSDRALANVKFRLNMNETCTADEIRRVEQLHLQRFNPELLFDVDAATLVSDTGVTADGIVISVIIRDRELGLFEKQGQWPLGELPEDLWGIDLQRFSFCRLDVVVIASPAESSGTLLATKAFKIREPSQRIDIPIKFVEPDELAKEGFDRGTICCVRWNGEDIRRSPAELVEVWLNKDLEDKYRALNTTQGGSATDHIARVVAAQVYGDVLAYVLASEDDSDEPESLVGIVKDMIQGQLGMTLDQARHTYQRGPQGRSRLAPWCWKLTGADRTFARLTV